MTVRQTRGASSSNQSSTAWQCSFKFSSHDEAIKAGLDVDTIVYGAPLKVGGKFEKSVVDRWKEDNCSRNSQNASFEGATYNYLREVAPGAMTAFAKCIESLGGSSALNCSVNREPGAVTVKWKRTDGEETSAAPTLKRLMVVNGTCSPGIPVGTVINEGGVGSPCIPEPSKDLMVMIETSRGICSPLAAYPKKIFSIAGTISMDGDRSISSDVVEFSPDSKIITNGNALTIAASEIKLNSQSSILSFASKLPSGAPGTPGDDGGTLIIRADRITGGDLRIDLSGQDGLPGAAGSQGASGSPGRNAKGRGLQGIRGCGGGHDATHGGPGGAGGDGSPGGAAGNGGTVVVQISGEDRETSLSHLSIAGRDGRTLPGTPGAGGAPGAGGPGGPGGAGDGGNDGCGGRGGKPGGPPGPQGLAGENGLSGKAGSISLN
ncbi:hypothetical protein OCOJLMKI_5129 [Methylobacterium iners]|uniref:Ig-like domain-containing protein n=1 Tax=Methylobacterium iners TaxID=418707 RepID=A0ABQ4S890_9HYPH|nr:hypothetical protein OCOJLMKI_5129 [Methylobacterium iners]